MLVDQISFVYWGVIIIRIFKILGLIKNARDALIEKNIKDKFIHINICYKNHTLKITVEDSAGGISDDIIGEVFKPYFSTKSKNGTGLGLYMSKMIIEDHYNGMLKVRNTKFGAKFTIILILNDQ